MFAWFCARFDQDRRFADRQPPLDRQFTDRQLPLDRRFADQQLPLDRRFTDRQPPLDRRFADRQPPSFSLIAKKTKQKKLFLFLSHGCGGLSKRQGENDVVFSFVVMLLECDGKQESFSFLDCFCCVAPDEKQASLMGENPWL